MAFGICKRCPANSRSVLLIGGLCDAHWRDQKEVVVRNDAPQVLKAIAAKEKNKTLSVWYDEQLRIMPKNCENCNKPITYPAGLSKRTPVCHILPKSTVPSVKTHEWNRWFGCWTCHGRFDNESAEKVKLMPVVKICRERLKEFIHLIPDSEMRHVPEFLK